MTCLQKLHYTLASEDDEIIDFVGLWHFMLPDRFDVLTIGSKFANQAIHRPKHSVPLEELNKSSYYYNNMTDISYQYHVSKSIRSSHCVSQSIHPVVLPDPSAGLMSASPIMRINRGKFQI